MWWSRRGRRVVVSGLCLVGLVGSVVSFIVLMPGDPTPTAVASGGAEEAPQPGAAPPTRTVGARGRQTVPARIGAITATLSLEGRIAGVEEVPLTFPAPGQVVAVPVAIGQTVARGQTVAELDGSLLQSELRAARSRLEVATIRMHQAEAQARIREREEAARRQAGLDAAEQELQRALADEERVKAGPPSSEKQQAESAVIAAQAEVRRVQADEARLRAGPPPADLRLAEQQVASAQLAQRRAEADLARVEAGPDPAAVRLAEQRVAQARVMLQRAEAEQARTSGGADPVGLRAAEREHASAEAAVVRAQADVDRLSRPDPLALSTADRDIQRAESALRAAKATKSDRDSRAARDAAIRSAELSLQDAIARRNQFRAGPPPAEVDIARRNLTVARSALEEARLRLEAARQGPSHVVINAANVAVEGARIDLDAAEAELKTLQAGPSEDALAAARDVLMTARAATDSARSRYAALTAGPAPDQLAATSAALTGARLAAGVAFTRLEELRSRPTEDELRDVATRSSRAHAALEQARAAATQPTAAEDDPSAYDLRLLKRSVDEEQAQVAELERQLADARLTAPFDGVVVQLKVAVGASAGPSEPAAVLAQPGIPMVLAELPEREGDHVAPGQVATVTVGEGPPLPAQVEGLKQGPTPATKYARLSVTWNAEPAVMGSPAQARVITQQRDQTLVVPQRAVRSAGSRRFVEYVDGATTRMADVTEGLSANGEVEILSGLTEGQLVVVGQ